MGRTYHTTDRTRLNERSWLQDSVVKQEGGLCSAGTEMAYNDDDSVCLLID